MPWKPNEHMYMGPHFMLLLSIYVLYSNVSYIYLISCPVEIKLFQLFQKIVSNCFTVTFDLHNIEMLRRP